MENNCRMVINQRLAEEATHHMNTVSDPVSFSGAVLIAKKGEILFSKAYGMADLEHNNPNTLKTKFRIGSLTKPFTATSIMQLVERNLLDVQDKVTKFIPDYTFGNEITIHQLLTHTSGIPNFTSFPEFRARIEKNYIKPLDFIELLNSKDLDFKPGDKYMYSNSGYYLLGMIIEVVSGMSFEYYLRENLFQPLDMIDSGYDRNKNIIPNRAHGYKLTENVLEHADYTEMLNPFAAGGLYSTVGDLLLWDQALYTEKAVKRETLEQMFTPYDSNYGYGWRIYDRYNQKVVEHGGGINGFVVHFQRYLKDNVCIIVLSNYQVPWATKIGYELAETLYNKR
jgi:CubicO group peptidase (beta-lactamase class C family)